MGLKTIGFAIQAHRRPEDVGHLGSCDDTPTTFGKVGTQGDLGGGIVVAQVLKTARNGRDGTHNGVARPTDANSFARHSAQCTVFFWFVNIRDAKVA